ncbi:SpaA isopeptide-forming pilin-related protein [Bifidobacterium pluvialisilvae]|uniref:SpaA isopeptide-forming pilin-related protein n=1 Tax=Bifidobacterium pluvialisilvae TaxID=2834436 RepID=UPI001F35072A|nr:SpaA isopeptide-forming pilin-related protein [Bifidobacterium pluvialisilvae]
MRRLFAGLAAAATLLSGLALGAGAANAATTPSSLPYAPLAAGQVDDQGKVTANATFKFTSENADQWGKNNNRVINAYKLADYYQYLDGGEAGVDQGAVFGVQTVDSTNDAAKEAVKSALTAALDGVTPDANDPYKGAVPRDADPLAWALQYGYLDQSATKPWTNKDGSDPAVESTTRKFADALTTTQGSLDKLGDPTVLSYDRGKGNLQAVTGDPNSFTADLPAGIYLFLDVTSYSGGHIQDGAENDAASKGKVVVNSAPIILASGHLTADGTTNKVNYLYLLGDITAGDNTVEFKNHVTPVSKTVDDSDKTVSTGQTVRYTLTSTLPLTTGSDAKTYVYQLTDYPGAGQTVNLDGFAEANAEGGAENAGAYDVKVYDGDKVVKTLVEGTDFDLMTSAANNGKEIVGAADNKAYFTLDFSKLIQSDDYNTTLLWGKTVKVTYAAKITGVHGDVPNTVEVNDNHTKAQHGTRLTLGGFQFTKTDAKGISDASINGATFTIKPDTGTADNKAVGLPDPDRTNKDLVAKYDKDGNGEASDEEIDHVADPWTGEGINESDSRQNGIVTFYGLADGTYTVTETKAPQGYLGAVSVKFNVTIKGGKAVAFKGIDKWGLAPTDAGDGNTEIADYAVKNVRSITELPKTGAAGIVFFTAVGLLLAGAAGAIFLKSRSASRALHA